MNEEFYIATFFDRTLDHGIFSPLPLLLPHVPGWPAALVPVSVNVVQYPLPTARRCYKFSQAVRRAIDSYRQDL